MASQIVHECGFVLGSPDCRRSHLPDVVEAERRGLVVDPDSAMQAMGRALANGNMTEAQAWSVILQGAVEYERLLDDRFGSQADATAVDAVSRALSDAAVVTLQKVASILEPARREGRRHPAIYEALQVVEEFQATTERMAG